MSMHVRFASVLAIALAFSALLLPPNARAATPATLLSPSPGVTLSSTQATTFTWTAGSSVSTYGLTLGTKGAGSSDLFSTGPTSSLTVTVGPLPSNGATIYATLYSHIAGEWPSIVYTFTEAAPAVLPVLLTPTPGSTLGGSSQIFTWSPGTGVTRYQLWIGTTGPGSKNLYDSDGTTATSASVAGLPVNGVTIYVTLYALINGKWQSTSYTYTAFSTPVTTLLPQAESILYTFTGNGNGTTDGWRPNGGMVMDSQGNLYGTTEYGGNGGGDYGAVFELSPSGQETILHSFGGWPNGDGSSPNGGLVRDAQGNLYGTTQSGGAGGYCIPAIPVCYEPSGTVFKISSNGTYNLLYSFAAPGFPAANTDGQRPQQGLIIDTQGNLYGTTSNGGNSSSCGTVFKVTPSGTETVLYSFNGPDGCNPGETYTALSGGGPGLVMDSNGNLYGTTYDGGVYGQGVVFKVTPNGTETVLHSFPGSGTDGYTPLGGLALDNQGNLYGITVSGGTMGWGTIFKVAPGGSESVLYNFNSGSVFPLQPNLVLDSSQQNLYGAIAGDQAYPGAVFQLSLQSGILTFLHLFPGYPSIGDGTYPQGGLLLENGNIYGTTFSDGQYASGTIFELSPSPSTTAPPIFSVAPGTYSTPQTIAITSATPGATILYSVNGGIPTYMTNGVTPYYTPVTIGSTSELTAIAIGPGGAPSLPVQANYIIP